MIKVLPKHSRRYFRYLINEAVERYIVKIAAHHLACTHRFIDAIIISRWLMHTNFRISTLFLFTLVINSTYQYPADEFGKPVGPPDAADVLYQRDASFIARLDNASPNASYEDPSYGDNSSGNSNSNNAAEDSDSFSSEMSNDIEDDDADDDDADNDDDNGRGRANRQPSNEAKTAEPNTRPSTQPTTTPSPLYVPSGGGNYYALSMEDMSVYDDVNNNRLNLPSAQEMYFKPVETMAAASDDAPHSTTTKTATLDMLSVTTAPPALPATSVDMETATSVATFGVDSTSHSYIRIDAYDTKVPVENIGVAIDGYKTQQEPVALSSLSLSSTTTSTTPSNVTATTASLDRAAITAEATVSVK